MSKKLILLVIAGGLLLASAAVANETTRAVQEELRRRHLFYGDIDGRETPAFLSAVRRYQERKGFPPTGTIDADTLRSMGIKTGAVERVALPDVPVLQSDRGLALGAREAGDTGAAAPAPGATAAPMPSKEEMRTFLRDYLKACRRNDVNDELGFYADRVDYFHHGTVEKEYIRNQLTSYAALWPARVYTIGNKLAIEQNGDKTVVRTRINFGLENPARSRRASGSADAILTLAKRPDGSWQIVGRQEERVRRYATAARSSGKRKQKQDGLTPVGRTLRKFFGVKPPKRSGKRR